MRRFLLTVLVWVTPIPLLADGVSVSSWQFQWLPADQSSPALNWQDSDSAWNPPGRADREALWLRFRLPYMGTSEPYLHLHRVKHLVRVFHDERRVYQFGDWQRRDAYQGFTSHSIDLSGFEPGEWVVLQIYSHEQKLGIVGDATVDRQAQHLMRMLRKDFTKVLVGCLCMIFGIGAMLLFLKTRLISLWDYAIFTLPLGLYFISLTDMKNLIMENITLWKQIELTSLFLSPAGFALILYRNLARSGSRSLLYISLFLYAYGFASVLVGLFSIDSLFAMLLLFQVFLLIGIPIKFYEIRSSARQGSEEAKIIFIGTLSFMIAASIDLYLAAVLSIPPMAMVWGILILISAAGYMIMHRAQKESQKRKTAEKVLQLESTQRQKIQNILNNLEEGILMVNLDLKMEDQYSPFLLKLFRLSHEDIQFVDVPHLLFGDRPKDIDQVDTWKTSLSSILGEGMIAWELNHSHLPAKHIRDIHGRDRHLAFTWTPMLENSIITKILVTVRDMTEQVVLQEKLQAEEAKNNQIKEIFLQLVRNERDRVFGFVEKTIAEISSLRALPPQEKGQSATFTTLHTIKGAARTLGLTWISNATQIAESVLSEHTKEVSISLLDEKLADLADILEKYYEVCKLIQGEAVLTEDHHQTIFALVHQFAPLMADSLGKVGLSLGRITCTDEVHEWSHGAFDLISKSLVHAVQNSVDHGYCLPSQRGDLDRQVANFDIVARRGDSGIEVIVRDFGAGINFDRLKQVAAKRGFPWKNHKELMGVVFLPEASTAEEVTMTSGRGVGVSAIKELVDGVGGEVELRANEPCGTQLIMTLPIRFVHPQKKAG